ncbi:MAG TPA: ABC transporter ATP-binding protein [Gaiellaceae bacterium]|jgi:iron(III) transport system ATP-binding protein|nr:ABC transporter ATP-binding protein [Gaiellaceae bacterium]
MTGAALVVTDVHKAFGTQPVLTGLDLIVPGGSFATVLGASGSGKTTLLRILAGFERADRGTVELGGTMLDDESRHLLPEKRQVGYVSQEGNLFPHLDVERNVGFGLPRRQRRGARVAELLETVGLGPFARRYPHQLSGGQQQRVALARALAIGSRIVLLDEPFASLDASLRAAVRADVQSILRDAGTTTILVTHDQDEALSSSDQVAVIRDGQIAQLGTPQELYAHPVDAELARFLGEVNLIDGTADNGLVETPLGSLKVHGTAPNGPVTVLVRPEQLELAPGAAPGVPGRVLGTRFHGHDTVVRLAPGGGGLPATLVARIRGGFEPAAGATLMMSVTTPVTAWSAAGNGRAPVGLEEPVAVESGAT